MHQKNIFLINMVLFAFFLSFAKPVFADQIFNLHSLQQNFTNYKEKNHLERSIFNNLPQKGGGNATSLPTDKIAKQENLTGNNYRYQKNFCVRLCDGFFFPVVTPQFTASNSKLQDEICTSFCPATATSFYRSYGGDQIKYAVNSSGQPYYLLDQAFSYRKKIDKTCSCQVGNQLGLSALKPSHDFTLRKGDIVTDSEKASVFLGSKSFPFKSNDFANTNIDYSQISSVTPNANPTAQLVLTLPKTTSEFLNQLKISNQYNLQNTSFQKNSEIKAYANLPNNRLSDAQYITSSGDIAGILRVIDLTRVTPKKNRSFQEILLERQKLLTEYGTRY